MEILSLGEKVRSKRKELNMTLKELAGDRITPGQISLIESGKSNPSMDLLEFLANTLNTSIEYLMESEEAQAEKVCTFFESMAESCMFNEEYEESEKYVEKGLYYADKYKLEYKKAKFLFLLGNISMELSENSTAQKHFLSANMLFIKNNSYEDIINTFIRLGKIALELRAYSSACSYFRQAEKVFMDNELANDFLLSDIFYYISKTYMKLEDFQSSKKYALYAKERFNKIENEKEYAKSLLKLAKEYSNKGESTKAIIYSTKALKAYRSIKDTAYVSEFENNMGKLFYEFNSFEDSFYFLNKARETRQKNRDSKVVDTLTGLCENYIKLKDIDNSKIVLQQILDNSGNGNDKALINYYMLKYKINILEGNLKDAEDTLIMALKFVTNLDYKKEQAEISILTGKFYMDMGWDKKASEYLKSAVGVLKDSGVFNSIY